MIPPLYLPDEDRADLLRRVNDPSLRTTERLRAQIVLMAAGGASNTEIADRLGVSRPTVTTWRARYEQVGLHGLAEGSRPGRPRRVDYQAIIRATLRRPFPPAAGSPPTCRSVGRELGVSPATVARTWRAFGVSPQPSGAFVFRTVPPLEATTVRVIARVGGRQGKVAVLSVDDARCAACRVGSVTDREDGEHPPGAEVSPGELVRRCVAAHPSCDLHVVADAAGRMRLRSCPAERAWWALRPRLHLHGVSPAVSWDLLLRAWLCGVS